MDSPFVTVIEVTADNLKELFYKYAPLGVNLGDTVLEKQVDDLLAKLRDQSFRRFLLFWTGSNIPRGAMILDDEVVWTQNGQVTVKRGEQLAGPGGRKIEGNMFFGPSEVVGTYDRLVKFGGESRQEHVMLVCHFANKRGGN